MPQVLVLLAASDELELEMLVSFLDGEDHCAFREPDLGDSLTAVALAETRATRRMTAGFPLTLASVATMTHRSQKQWKLDHPDAVAEHKRRWRARHPEVAALHRVRWRARQHGIPFSITVADLPPIPERCPALGILLDRSSDDWRTGPSLDRIVPALGYVPGNVQWLSRLANTMKQDATPDQLTQFAHWILREGVKK